MSDFSKTVEKFAAAPWRVMLAVIGASFIVATIVSTIAGHVVSPQEIPRSLVPKKAQATASFNVPAPTASLSQPQIDSILKRNLFNSDGAAEDPGASSGAKLQPSAEAVKSDLPVKLVGTIYGGDPYSGIALVEKNDAKHSINSFMVGDTLLKDVVVKEIHREKIIVDRQGRLEYIEVEKQVLARSRRKKKTGAASTSDYVPIATNPPPSSYREEGFERKDREISMTQAYKNKLLTTDITKVLQDAKATPNMVNGELKGFTLTRIREGSIYQKAGLQNDDIVEEINGVPLTDAAQAIRLLQSLRNENEVDVRIRRGGSPLKFNLMIR